MAGDGQLEAESGRTGALPSPPFYQPLSRAPNSFSGYFLPGIYLPWLPSVLLPRGLEYVLAATNAKGEDHPPYTYLDIIGYTTCPYTLARHCQHDTDM